MRFETLQATVHDAPPAFTLPRSSAARDAVKPRIALVGMGPHSRRIYMHYLNRLGLKPALVVELDGMKDFTLSFLSSKGISCETVWVDDAERDANQLPMRTIGELDFMLNEKGITHAILSTEPKAHNAYLTYFLSRGIHTLTDKPITAPCGVSTQERMADQL